jgi:hypothetical protein
MWTCFQTYLILELMGMTFNLVHNLGLEEWSDVSQIIAIMYAIISDLNKKIRSAKLGTREALGCNEGGLTVLLFAFILYHIVCTDSNSYNRNLELNRNRALY